MIKLTSKDKIKSVVWIALFFAVSLALKLNLSVTLLLLLLYAYLKFKKLSIKDYCLLNVLLLYVLGLVSSYYIINKGLSVLLIPFSVIPMLATLLFNNLTISLLLLLAICVSAASFSRSPFTIMLLFLISGVLSSFMTHNARKRNTIIRAGLAVGIAQVATLIFLDNFWIGLPNRYAVLFLNGVISSVLVLGVLPVFEYLFKTLTNVSLLEVADFNHPILQRMVLEAPGTYHHSLVVGNISEAACEAVGANALLARVGAYYHDIGKLQKPAYFSENQSEKESKHDKLAPTMSKLIIMNHVKEGVELAKKYKLNPLLIEFIQQHHGNSLVFYFYRRALEGLEDDEEVKEEGFRYPGPKPNTKETAIVLLADSVEAATRALKETDPGTIEGLVHKIINNKFIDGQLDECDLTLKDLEKISACFIRILSGIYHSRVPYPEEERSENSHKKFPEADSHLSEQDKKSNP